MIDINRIRENPEAVRTALLKRMDSISFDELLLWDEQHRALLVKVEGLRARRNQVSDEIPALKREGKDVTSLLEEMKGVSTSIKEIDKECDELHQRIHSFLEALPNIPADDVVAGGKENNQVVRSFGEKPHFDFTGSDINTSSTTLLLIYSLNPLKSDIRLYPLF